MISEIIKQPFRDFLGLLDSLCNLQNFQNLTFGMLTKENSMSVVFKQRACFTKEIIHVCIFLYILELKFRADPSKLLILFP